ncbi:LOW QUALITY PROTEIN: nuclear factor erythroid 2-related factor 3 [Porphyrio hochstetteri]
MAEDVDLKACQEALDGCRPHHGGDQLELQEEENRNQCFYFFHHSLLSLEGCLQLLSSQMGNMLEVSLLDDTQVATSSRGQDPPFSHHSVSLTQTLCHCFGPHDATLLRTDYPAQSNSETRHLQRQESFPQSSSNVRNAELLLHESDLTGLLSAADLKNQMAHDNFGEIKLMSLEEGFDPIEVSQLSEKHGSEFKSLNSSRSAISVCTEGSVGYSSDVKSVSSHGLGAVGGHSQRDSKYGHVEYLGGSEHSREDRLHLFLHNHTYNQLPSQAASTPEYQQQMWMEKPHEVEDGCHNSTDTNLSSDEHRAKPLRIPFSVDEIMIMPVDSFNAMLAKNHLADTQVSLPHVISGKNKVAAQNCHKRKLNATLNLEDVCHLQTQECLKKHSEHSRSISRMKQKLNHLHCDIFSRLRDDQGRPVNPCHRVIHCSNSGRVFVIPKHLVKSEQKQDNEKEQKQK